MNIIGLRTRDVAWGAGMRMGRRLPRRNVAWASGSLAVLVCALATSGPAMAQDGDAQASAVALDEIVVTAQRREESLQRTPVAVSAFSSEMLEQRQIDNIGGLQNAVPSLTIVSGRGSTNNAQISLRGVGQMSQTLQFDPGVGIYVDDVYLGRAQGSLFDLYGISRIEVLRGPQGTLYGRNTIGGAVKVISERPDLSGFEGEARLRLGSYEYFDASASVNVPLAEDRAAVRVGVLRRSREGYQRNFDGMRASSQDIWGGRISLLWRPADGLDVLINADGTDDRSSVVYGRQMNVLDYGELGEFEPTPGPYRTTSSVPNDNYYKNYGVSANVGWEASDALSLRSITAYRRNWFRANLDIDGVTEDLFSSLQHQRQWQFSQELQANVSSGDLDLVAGLFYFHEKSDSNLQTNSLVALSPTLNLAVTSDTDSDITTKSYAAFVHGNYEITPRLSVGAGLRYSRDTKTTSIVADGKRSFESVVPKVSVDYRPTDNIMTYASYARGFKAGSFNVFATSTIVPFDPETVDSLEFGIKSDWFGRRLRLNLTAFHASYNNFQADSVIPNPVDGTPTRLTVNAAEATTKGVEVELFWRPVANLDLTGTYAYLDASFDDYRNSPFGDLSGTPLANSPRHTVGLSARYAIPVGDRFELALQGDATYRSASYRYPGTHANIVEAPNTIANALVTFSPLTERWQLSAGVKNLTNKAVLADGYDVPFGTNHLLLLFYKEPRTWTAGLTYRF